MNLVLQNVYKCCGEGFGKMAQLVKYLRSQGHNITTLPPIHTRSQQYNDNKYGKNQPPIVIIMSDNGTFEMPLDIHWKNNINNMLNWRNKICTK